MKSWSLHKEPGLILFPLTQLGFTFDCLSLLLAWCYYWHGSVAFIIHFYAAVFCAYYAAIVIAMSSPCWFCVMDLWVADLALRPILSADLTGRQVTYSQLIDIFISGGHHFKTLKRRHLSGERARPDARQTLMIHHGSSSLEDKRASRCWALLDSWTWF